MASKLCYASCRSRLLRVGCCLVCSGDNGIGRHYVITGLLQELFLVDARTHRADTSSGRALKVVNILQPRTYLWIHLNGVSRSLKFRYRPQVAGARMPMM
jgi:hypothetical protein